MIVYVLIKEGYTRDVTETEIISIFKEYKRASDAHEQIITGTRDTVFIQEYEVIE